MNITWNLSGGIIHKTNIIGINDYLNKFYENDKMYVHSVFDSLPGLRWNAGRGVVTSQLSIEDLLYMVDEYNNKNIGFNFTFSNSQLTYKDLEDEYCNFILEKCHNNLNGVIMSSDILNEYIKKNYPLYKRICSATKDLRTIEQYNDNCDKYDIVVLCPDFNTNFDFITKIKDISKLEVIVNEPCVHGCPFRSKHYRYLEKQCMDFNKRPFFVNNDEKDIGKCIARLSNYSHEKTNVIDIATINKLIDLGVNKFKMVGRELSWERYEYDIKYFIEKMSVLSLINKK